MAASAVGGQETGADPFKGFGIHARQAREKAKALGLALDYDTPPKAVKLRAPKYPEIAPGRRAQGTVLLMIVIDSTGHVPQAEVLESIPALDAAALKCVASWRFKPALKNGQPVSTLAISPVTFRVER
jgi:protein TonB